MFVPAVTGSNHAPRPTGAPALPAVAVKAAPAPRTADVQRAIAAIRETLRPVSNGLEFSVDQSSGKTVVRVVDLETQQLIRQIPSEEIVEIARALKRLEGILFRQQA